MNRPTLSRHLVWVPILGIMILFFNDTRTWRTKEFYPHEGILILSVFYQVFTTAGSIILFCYFMNK